MNLLVQDTLAIPGDWRSLDLKADPLAWEKLVRNVPGFLMMGNCQGLMLGGADHVAVRPVTVDGEPDCIEATSWWDDPAMYIPDDFRARVWTIKPLDHDPNLGGAINTRQSQVVYAAGARYQQLLASPPQNTIVLPWADFNAPSSIARHGVQVPDALYQQHLAAQTLWGWRHWVDHLDEGEVDWEAEYTHDGQRVQLATPRRMLKVQREMGRWSKAKGTITYYQRDTDRAAGWTSDTHEDALELTTATAATESSTIDGFNVPGVWAFSTPDNEPNSPDWPDGTYRYQLDVTAASEGLTHGDVSTGSDFFRGSLDLASSLESVDSATGAQSGTGLFITTASWNPAAGAANNRYGIRVGANGDSHGDAITLRLNTADSYADGPWSTGADGTDFPWPQTYQPVQTPIAVISY